MIYALNFKAWMVISIISIDYFLMNRSIHLNPALVEKYFCSIFSKCRCWFCSLGSLYKKHRGRRTRGLCCPFDGCPGWINYWTYCTKKLSTKTPHASSVVGRCCCLWSVYFICRVLECIPLKYIRFFVIVW